MRDSPSAGNPVDVRQLLRDVARNSGWNERKGRRRKVQEYAGDGTVVAVDGTAPVDAYEGRAIRFCRWVIRARDFVEHRPATIPLAGRIAVPVVARHLPTSGLVVVRARLVDEPRNPMPCEANPMNADAVDWVRCGIPWRGQMKSRACNVDGVIARKATWRVPAYALRAGQLPQLHWITADSNNGSIATAALHREPRWTKAARVGDL